MSGNLSFNDNDDVQLKGATDLTLIGNVGDALKVSSLHTDTAPANQTITAVDSGTSNLTGANGQVFYFGTPTTNSAATFALSSIESVEVQANLLGGGGTLVVEVSSDGGSFWFRPNVYQVSTQNYTNSFTAPFNAILNTTGMTHVRVRAITSWSGTGTIIAKESLNARMVTVGDALPTGANVIGGVTQSGTWTVQPGNTANTTAWKVDGSAVTQPVSAASLPLPTGASTSALQTTGNTSLSSIDGKLTDFGSQLLDADILNVSSQYRAQNATTSASEALGAGTILSNRKSISITPTAGTIYWGTSNAVTTSSGTPIFKNQTFTVAAGPSTHIWIIAGSTIDCRIVELS